MKCGFFGSFFYVEQYFIPKKSVSSWPSEGWTNEAQPNNQNQPNKILFYIQIGPKNPHFILDIVFSNKQSTFAKCESKTGKS